MRKISHELKSPLSAIQTTAQTLIEGYAGDIPVTQKNLLETIVRRTKSMSNLVIDMLSLSKVAESLPHKVPEPVDFREILLEEIKSFDPIIKKKNLKLNESLVEVPKIWAFKEEIAELVKNLTENAVKYTPENGNVSLVLNSQKKAIRLIVSDSGIGIEPKDLPRLFEQFFRGETAKKIDKEGTGLGLAIVKTIVEKHKGKIEVLSKPGKGSAFTVTIPLKTGFERE
jgi:signal transduction histidine kinase